MLLDRQRELYSDYFDWYQGRLDTLFNVAPTPVNGLSLITAGQAETRFNYFAAVSRFYGDAMLADSPELANEPYALLESLTEHWAVTGESCILVSPGGVRAIRPDYVFPVFSEYDIETVERYVFVFPIRKPEGGLPDRARVIDYDTATGRATIAVREYRRGYVADLPAGEPIEVSNVIWVQTFDGVYPQIAGMVREVIIRMNVLQAALNAVAFPILQIDTDAVSGGSLERGVSQSRVTAAGLTGLGLTVPPPFIGEEGARYVERTGQGFNESFEYLRMVLGQLGVTTGVPDYVFGVQLGRPANETERVLFTGQAKVNRFRRDMESAFELLGIPLKFGSEPFVTRAERLNAILRETAEGIITVNEARTALGYPPLDRERGGILRAIRETVTGVRGVL